ncbi:MAG TPA: DUF58 domain-containing protein [Anaerolineae bacterium]|nr:DUF58 domain-containing protein [Anaerolineae bacterium]
MTNDKRPMTNDALFDEAFMRKLEQLSLVARKIRSGKFRGERKSAKRGQSVEFADYRNYTRGDDLRALDWNIYARLERPFIKLFEEEVDQTVHILFDASASMDWPLNRAEHNKWIYARRLVASLGYIALANNDRLYVSALSEDKSAVWGPERRKQSIHRLLGFLAKYPAAGQTRLSPSLTRYAQQAKRPGLLFLISDFLTNNASDSYESGLSALQYRGHEVAVLHLLSPDEIAPSLSGDFQLQDVESGAKQEITVNATMKKLYRQQFTVWQGELEQFCRKHNINYALVASDKPFERLMLRYLRRRGFVK